MNTSRVKEDDPFRIVYHTVVYTKRKRNQTKKKQKRKEEDKRKTISWYLFLLSMVGFTFSCWSYLLAIPVDRLVSFVLLFPLLFCFCICMVCLYLYFYSILFDFFCTLLFFIPLFLLLSLWHILMLDWPFKTNVVVRLK